MPEQSVTTRIAQWSIRHPWWAIGAWLAFVAATVVLGGAVETRQATDADLGVGESGRAEQMISSAGLTEPATEQVLITATGAWDVSAGHAAAREATDRLGGFPQVSQIGEPVPSPHTEALLVPVTLAGDRDDAADRVAPLLAEVAAVDDDHPHLRVEMVGNASISHGIDAVISEDLAWAGLVSLPVTLAVLLVVFGALVAAGVPLLLGFTAVAAATGLWAHASQVIPDVGTVPQLILLIGLAVGVDYSLFYIRRQREERRRGHGTVDAVRIAAATSGRAVVTSAVTSVVALAGLYLAGDGVFRALGTGVILVVAVAMVGSLTALPALLATLGRATDWPRVPVLWRVSNPAAGRETAPAAAAGGEAPEPAPRVWRKLLAPVLRAPRTAGAVALVALILLALPALGMNLRAASVEDVPRTVAVMQGYDRLVDAFPGQGDTHRVVVRADPAEAEAVRDALAGLAVRAGDDPRFAVDTAPQVRTSPDRTVSVMALGIPDGADAPQEKESLRVLRSTLLPEATAPMAGAESAVTGIVAYNVDYTSQQAQRLLWVLGFVVLLTVGVMALAFRSVVVALVAGALAVVSVAAALGLLVLVFQHTWAEGLLGFTSGGHLTDWVPLFLFVVLFGLSTDYHVYVVTRIREHVRSGMDTRQAIRAGMVRSAGTVVSAAAVMVAVFSIFVTLSLIEMKQLGFGLAAAVAIDATLVRLVLLPSVMLLLGRVNWWPSSASRRPAGGAPRPTAQPELVLDHGR